MSHLHATITNLASDFAGRVLQAIRSAPLGEIVPLGHAPAQKAAAASAGVARPGRPGRTSGVDIDQSLTDLLALLGRNPDGAQGGALRRQLRLSKGQFLRVAAAGVHSNKMRREGERRGIRYFLR